MEDSRFTAMFKDSDFHIDTTSEEFRLLNPVVSKLDKAKKKRAVIAQQFDEIEVHYDFRITYIYQRVCEMNFTYCRGSDCMVAGFTTTYAIDQFHINRFFVVSGLIPKSNRSKIWVVSSLIVWIISW
jgi:hypothetical protein